MRHHGPLLCVAIGVVVAVSPHARGQGVSDNGYTVRGMFGERTLGESLKPQPRQFGGGIVTGPAGEFRGRGRVDGMRFSNMPWQYPVGVEKFPGTPPAFSNAVPWGLVPRPLPPRPGDSPAQPPAPPLEPTEIAPPPEQPEMWFREPSEAENTEEPAPPANVDQSPNGNSNNRVPNLKVGSVRSSGSPERSVAETIRRTGRIQKLSPITVTIENETAVLRGQVATEHDRRLAESVAQLEPGIWRVRNELTVSPSTSAVASRRPGRSP